MKIRLFLILGILLAACVPSARPASTPTEGVSAMLTGVSTIPPGSVDEPVEGIEDPAAIALGLTLLAPETSTIVNVPEVEVVGRAAPGAVLALNELIVIVDSTGSFTVTLPLEEGPNLIEIEASDADGNGAYLDLMVTYAPSE